MDKKRLAAMMDHTILKAAATPAQVETVCREALAISAASVCINPCNIALASRLLLGSSVKVCTVVGFPLGANTPETKAFETADAVEKGAQEIDMVINIGALIAGDHDRVYRDIKGVVGAAKGNLVKVIIETCYLNEEQIRAVCELCMKAGAHYVKTSTGFGTAGAKPEHVRLMRSVVGTNMKIKAAGGIRTYQDAMNMIEASADRLGVSASVAILDEAD